MLWSFLFDSNSLGEHRVLHSFPTRRSSDLPPRDAQRLLQVGLETKLLESRDGRSEEHTSELQSRGHLVCRLLLEKKKCVDLLITASCLHCQCRCLMHYLT